VVKQTSHLTTDQESRAHILPGIPPIKDNMKDKNKKTFKQKLKNLWEYLLDTSAPTNMPPPLKPLKLEPPKIEMGKGAGWTKWI
jgi:hypothetical protein